LQTTRNEQLTELTQLLQKMGKEEKEGGGGGGGEEEKKNKRISKKHDKF
jgi:hypothetical protein